MSAPTREQLATRIRTTESTTLIASARSFDIAAEDIRDAERRVRALTCATGLPWDGTAHRAWLGYLGLVAARLTQTVRGLGELAGALREIAHATDCARTELAASTRLLDSLRPESPDASAAAAHAYLAIERTTRSYHDSERRIRTNLWRLGDSAPVGVPPTPPLLPPPDRPWWQELLDTGALGATWITGRNGAAYGLDEDGNVVPAPRGHPVQLVRGESGVGDGLAKLVPRVVRDLRDKSALTEGQVTEAFAQTVRESQGWREGHINRHIREWYGLKKGTDIPAWMRKEFFDKVVRACVRPDKVVMGRLPDGTSTQPAYEVLYHDPATRRHLMVRFYVKGNHPGELATAFRPTQAQIDQFLRKEATKGA